MNKSKTALWCGRLGRFLLDVALLCGLGALLGAVLFPMAGAVGGSHKSWIDLAALGARSGGFFLLVWAPGIALVRGFVLAAKPGKEPSSR